jgi:hypothetical protein
MPRQLVIFDVELVYSEGERPARRFHARASGPDGYVELVLPERAAARLLELLTAVKPDSLAPATE